MSSIFVVRCFFPVHWFPGLTFCDAVITGVLSEEQAVPRHLLLMWTLNPLRPEFSFLIEELCILFPISLKFVCKGPIQRSHLPPGWPKCSVAQPWSLAQNSWSERVTLYCPWYTVMCMIMAWCFSLRASVAIILINRKLHFQEFAVVLGLMWKKDYFDGLSYVKFYTILSVGIMSNSKRSFYLFFFQIELYNICKKTLSWSCWSTCPTGCFTCPKLLGSGVCGALQALTHCKWFALVTPLVIMTQLIQMTSLS